MPFPVTGSMLACQSDAEGKTIMTDKKNDSAQLRQAGRREALRRLGRFAAVTPPAVALVLAAKTKPANAIVISTDTTDNV